MSENEKKKDDPDPLQEGAFVEKLIRNTDSIEAIIKGIKEQYPDTIELSLPPDEEAHILDEGISKYQRWTRFYNWFVCEVKSAVEENKWDLEGMKDVFFMANSETPWRLIHSLVFKKNFNSFVNSEDTDEADSPEKEDIDPYILRKNAYDAARDGDLETLKSCIKNTLSRKTDKALLTKSGGSTSNKSILHMAVFKSYDESLIIDHVDCVKQILRYAQLFHKKNEILDRVDRNNQTALEIAIENKSEDICEELLSHGADISCSRKHSDDDDDDHETKCSREPNNELLQKLYLELPGVVDFLFNRDIELKLENKTKNHTEARNNKESKEMKLHLNYTHIIGFTSQVTNTNIIGNKQITSMEMKKSSYTPVSQQEMEMGPIGKSSKSDGEEKRQLDEKDMDVTFLARMVYAPRFSSSTLRHPLVKIFVERKWESMKYKLGTYFIAQTLFYLLYLGLMVDIFYCKCPQKVSTNETALPEEHNACSPTWIERTLIVLLYIFNVALFIMEIFEFRKLKQLKIPMEEITWKFWKIPYFHEVENYFQFFFNIFSVASTLPFLIQQNFFYDEYCAASIGILISAVLLLCIFGNANIPTSEYVFVYGKICKRLAAVLMTFSPIIIAFIISFFITFPEVNFFYFSKIFIMLTGEFNFDDDFNSEKLSQQSLHSIVGQTQYVLFGFTVTIVFVNIFLGYAIDDIQELKSVVDETRRKIQIKQLFLMDEIIKTFCCKNKCTAQGSNPSASQQYTDVISLGELPIELQNEIRQIKKKLQSGRNSE